MRIVREMEMEMCGCEVVRAFTQPSLLAFSFLRKSYIAGTTRWSVDTADAVYQLDDFHFATHNLFLKISQSRCAQCVFGVFIESFFEFDSFFSSYDPSTHRADINSISCTANQIQFDC